MITLQLEEKNYSIPSAWVDITIKQFQQLNDIDVDLDTITKNLEIINVLSGIEVEQLLKLPFTNYAKLLDAISFLNGDIQDKIEDKWEHNGIVYKFDAEITKYPTAAFLDMDAYVINGIDDLHKLVAIIYRPLINGKISKYKSEEVKERAQIMQKHMPISMGISTQLFFSVFVNNSLKHTKVCS